MRREISKNIDGGDNCGQEIDYFSYLVLEGELDSNVDTNNFKSTKHPQTVS